MRFQLEISEDEEKEWKKLMKRTNNIKTKKGLIINAIALLTWALNERMAGRIITSLDEKEMKYKELIMPIFPSKKEV